MKLFDATYFLNKPPMPAAFERLPNVNENFIFDGMTLNETKLLKYISRNQLIQFDIEKENNVPAILRNLQLRVERLGPARHGFFGQPFYQYERDQATFDAWAQKYKVVMDHVDAFFPEMYSYAIDPIEWGKCLDFMMSNLRKIANGKPIYPFLWFIHPYKLPSTPVYIGDEFWQFQLNQCRKKADGAVIWGGYLETWDDNASWWKILQHYIKAA